MDLPDKSVGGLPAAPKKNITVLGQAKKVERPATRRFFDFLFAESPKDLAKKVGREVIVPRAKAGFEEAFGSFLSGMLWGGGGRPMGSVVQSPTMRTGGVNYQSVSTQNAMLAARQASVPVQSSGNYQDLVLPTQQHAEAYLAGMFDLLNQYRVVAVADLYEMAAITPAISDNSYGWTSLEGSRISKVREGFLLELPRPTLI